MDIQFVEEEIKYTGIQLAPHWIYKNFGIMGDSAVSFIGECDVKLSEMVDIEDVINNSPIYSKKMLHFIIEHFNINLPEGVVRQRLFLSVIKETLEKILPGTVIVRNGDDLFYNEKKLTVSIAAKSTVSVLIHTGINIDSNDAPANAAGLVTDLNMNNIKQFAHEILMNYKNETDSIKNAAVKVRGIV